MYDNYCDPYQEECSFVDLDFRPSLMDVYDRGFFDVCGLWYLPLENFNSWRDEEDLLEIEAMLPNGTEKHDPYDVDILG